MQRRREGESIFSCHSDTGVTLGRALSAKHAHTPSLPSRVKDCWKDFQLTSLEAEERKLPVFPGILAAIRLTCFLTVEFCELSP